MNPRIDELRALLQDDPGSRRFFQLGELLRKENELVEAETVLRSGLEHHPRYVAAWVSLGRIEFATTRWAEAEKSYAHALELDPENTVAARLIGETAEEQRQWERALKAYQLANMLSGRDPELGAKILKMERRIAGDETFEAPTEPDLMPVYSEEPIASFENDFDVLEESEEVFEQLEVEIPLPSTERELEVFSFSDDDPFAIHPTGDTGVWLAGDDVFSSPPFQEEPVPEEDAVFVQDRVAIEEPMEMVGAEPDILYEAEEYDGLGDPYSTGVDEQIPAIDLAVEPDVTPIPSTEADPQDTTGETWDSRDDVPLPTLTLARLAIDQNDVDLAKRTLRSLLKRSPGDSEALSLLAQLDGDTSEILTPPLVELDSGQNLAAAKATVLQGWMDAIRLAAERRAP